MNLNELGWTPERESAFAPHTELGHVPGRVVRQDRGRAIVACTDGIVSATIAGRLLHECGDATVAAVGDWVALSLSEDSAVIHAVLQRTSLFSRKRAGAVTTEQVVAANIDWVLLVCGLDGDFNVRRIERALTLVYNSGASPVVILNKADVCDDVDQRIAEVESVALGVPVHAMTALDAQSIEVLRPYLQGGRTLAAIGSSGVGKSTLINTLLGDIRQRTDRVRHGDDRGRHTTTHRELFVLPDGGAIIDTPGMRELQLWADQASLDAAFADIEEVAHSCRFADCTHTHEPGCAVVAAVADGTLDEDRVSNYHKMQRELAHLARRQDHLARSAEKAKWKSIHKDMRKLNKQRWK